MEQVINIVEIKNLKQLLVKNPNASMPLYNPDSGKVERILVADLVGGETVKVPWVIDQNYMIDEIAEFNNKIWKSLQDNNVGHQPYDDQTWWVEVSPSSANGTALQPWAAGIFNIVNSSVTVNNVGYLLNNSVTLPFNSTDFATELASNIWLPLGSSITLASQAEAESNTENTKFLSSLRTFQNWYNNVKTYVITELNTTAKTIVGALNYFNNNVLITKEPTGFLNPDAVNVSYDGITRKVTLTGSVEAYYRGNLITALVSGWVSDAHDIADGQYFLYYNGTAFVWSNSQWPFDAVMIAMAYRDGSNFCLRECHGLMAWQTHQELHETLGTYLKSGGDLSGFTLASTTATNRRPQISSAIVKDEDLGTTLPALTINAYTQLFLSGANTANTSVDQPEITPVLGNNPYYNRFTGGNWIQTLFPINAYGKIFIMAVPVTSDVECQKKRFIFIQPQTVSTTLATIQAITSSSVNLGHIAGALSEYVFIGEIIIRYASNNWTLISTAKLVGTKVVQASIIGGGGGGASTAANVIVDATGFDGNLAPTDTNQQLVNEKVDDLPIWKNDVTAWAGNETTLTLTSQKRRLFGSVAVTTAVTVTLVPPTSPYLEHYFFKFKHGTGGSFSFTGVTLAPDTPTLVVGSIYEASITDGVLRYQKAVS